MLVVMYWEIQMHGKNNLEGQTEDGIHRRQMMYIILRYHMMVQYCEPSSTGC